MRSYWNQSRFLRSVSLAHYGNPQPLRSTGKWLIYRLFNSTTFAKPKIRRREFFVPRSSGLLKGGSHG